MRLLVLLYKTAFEMLKGVKKNDSIIYKIII
jgi:hypothetical protein